MNNQINERSNTYDIHIKTSTAASPLIRDPRNFYIEKWAHLIHHIPSDTYSLIFICGSMVPVGGIILPTYSKGIYITAGGEDACFVAVDHTLKFYVGYRNLGSWTCRIL